MGGTASDDWQTAAKGTSLGVAVDARRLYCLGKDDAIYIWLLEDWPFEKKPKRVPAKLRIQATLAAKPNYPPKAPGHMRLVCISDTHCMHRSIWLPQGDVLLHAGDMTNNGTAEEFLDVAAWFE